MPGDKQKSMNEAENHARSAIISSTMSVHTTVFHELRHRGIYKIPKCFTCPSDCKEYTSCSTHNSNQSHGRPDHRPPTTRQSRSGQGQMRHQKCFSNLGNRQGTLHKEAKRCNSRNQDSSQLTVYQSHT